MALNLTLTQVASQGDEKCWQIQKEAETLVIHKKILPLRYGQHTFPVKHNRIFQKPINREKMLRQSATTSIYYLYQTEWHQKSKNYIDALDNSHRQIIYRHLHDVIKFLTCWLSRKISLDARAGSACSLSLRISTCSCRSSFSCTSSLF